MKKAAKIFIHDPAKSFAPRMMEISNAENSEQVFRGLQSIPIASHQGYKVNMHDIEGSIHTPGFNETFNAGEYRTWIGTRLEYVFDFKNLRKVIHPLKSILEIEFTVVGNNKIEYRVSNDSLKALDITDNKWSLKLMKGWPGRKHAVYRRCNKTNEELILCGKIEFQLNQILCHDDRVKDCFGFGAFTTANTDRKITFVYTFEKHQEKNRVKRMPGLMLRWKTVEDDGEQWPDKVLEVSELGREVKSPDFGKKWKKDWGRNRQKKSKFPRLYPPQLQVLQCCPTSYYGGCSRG